MEEIISTNFSGSELEHPFTREFKAFKEKYKSFFDAVQDKKKKFEIMNKVASHVNGLRIKYPNIHTYVAYHVLAGSTIDKRITPLITAFDLPEEDSLVSFLDNLIKEYLA